MRLFRVLNAVEQKIYELGWRAGYAARMADEQRQTRRVHSFEGERALTVDDDAYTALLLRELTQSKEDVRAAFSTIISLAVQYGARASETYARTGLAIIERNLAVLHEELNQG
jgi:hypothetical protein